MSEREQILKEMVDRVGDELSKEIVAKKAEQFMKYGRVFLFFELMNLRREVEILKSKIEISLAAPQKKY